MSTTTTQMGLKIPQLGDPSPGYVSDIASTIASIDAHDHSSGKGAPLNQNSLTFNGPLSMNGQALVTTRHIQFTPQFYAYSAASDNGSLYMYNQDLYYLDGNNILVRLTSGGKPAGSIGGDYSSYPLAQITYSNPDLAYYFRDSANNFAKLNALSIGLGTSTSTNGTLAYGNLGSGLGLYVRDSSSAFVKIFSGDISAYNITCSSLAAGTGSVTGASGTFTGTMSANALSATNGVSAASMTATGTIQAATLTATGTPGAVNCNSLSSSGAVSGATASISGNAAVNTLNAVAGVLQGSRFIALRGLVKASTLTAASGAYPITSYVDGATPAFSQTTFTAPYAGSIAALTCRSYGATGTAGSIYLSTSGLSANATTSSFAFGTVNSGASQTFSAGTYTFSAGTVFTVNINTTSWAQVSTGATGVEVTAWVYC